MANNETVATPIFDELLREMTNQLDQTNPTAPEKSSDEPSAESVAKAPSTGRRRKAD